MCICVGLIYSDFVLNKPKDLFVMRFRLFFLTFWTSCLHLSTFSCSFFCWSGVTEASVLPLASRVAASFSSLQAMWYVFLAASICMSKHRHCQYFKHTIWCAQRNIPHPKIGKTLSTYDTLFQCDQYILYNYANIPRTRDIFCGFKHTILVLFAPVQSFHIIQGQFKENSTFNTVL